MRNRWSQALLAALILGLLTFTAVGVLTAAPAPADRAYELEQRLRCPVCKSVSVAESMSETAQAMRESVQEQIAAGRGDQEIIDYFRARYGDWVLLDPPAGGSTLALWLIPVGVGLAGAAVVLLRPRPAAAGELPAEDRRRVAAAVARMRAESAEDDAS